MSSQFFLFKFKFSKWNVFFKEWKGGPLKWNIIEGYLFCSLGLNAISSIHCEDLVLFLQLLWTEVGHGSLLSWWDFSIKTEFQTKTLQFFVYRCLPDIFKIDFKSNFDFAKIKFYVHNFAPGKKSYSRWEDTDFFQICIMNSLVKQKLQQKIFFLSCLGIWYETIEQNWWI